VDFFVLKNIIFMSSIEGFKGEWSFLSNFYPCEIQYDGLTYKSVEHFYVAMKFNNEQMINGKHYTIGDFREMISLTPSPGLVKKIGQKIIIRSDWDIRKLRFMNWAIREKFKDINLSELLIGTEDVELVESNNWNDTFWGVCNGKGKNHLGKILMKVRDELRGVEKKTGLEEFFN
jgi:ribA/ribD-fused uncharacterized protein